MAHSLKRCWKFCAIRAHHRTLRKSSRESKLIQARLQTTTNLCSESEITSAPRRSQHNIRLVTQKIPMRTLSFLASFLLRFEQLISGNVSAGPVILNEQRL